MIYEQTQFWGPGLQWAETDMPVKCTFIHNQAHKSNIFYLLYLLFYSVQ